MLSRNNRDGQMLQEIYRCGPRNACRQVIPPSQSDFRLSIKRLLRQEPSVPANSNSLPPPRRFSGTFRALVGLKTASPPALRLTTPKPEFQSRNLQGAFALHPSQTQFKDSTTKLQYGTRFPPVKPVLPHFPADRRFKEANR